VFNKAIIIVLIATITACPLWCSSGLVQCCAAHAADVQPGSQVAGSCCATKGAGCSGGIVDSRLAEAPQPWPETPQPVAPCHRDCQGVCGGAVLEKPADDAAPAAELVLFVEVFAQLEAVAAPVYPQANDDQSVLSGRELRTFYVSMLC